MQNTKKKRGLQSSLFSCPKTHLKYFHYIMNFSKVNVRDLAEAKYEDTYLLIATRFPWFTLAKNSNYFSVHCQSKNSLEHGAKFVLYFWCKKVEKLIDNITWPRGLSDTRLCYNFIRRLALWIQTFKENVSAMS